MTGDGLSEFRLPVEVSLLYSTFQYPLHIICGISTFFTSNRRGRIVAVLVQNIRTLLSNSLLTIFAKIGRYGFLQLVHQRQLLGLQRCAKITFNTTCALTFLKMTD